MSNKQTAPRPTKAESRADSTDRIARELIDAENAARDEKTRQLREARLASEKAEADQPAEEAPAKPARKR